jgi:eukaryotic-like serine/threonine-protein kinase
MPLGPGSTIASFKVQALLGKGGMGEVFSALDTRLDRKVALKFLPAELAGNQERLRRFESEARALAALNHPNILVIHETGVHDGAPFLVSELLEGGTLRDLLQSGPLPRRRAIELASQLAHGLAAAHSKGVIHRDLKPENIFVTPEGRLKILDFGLAKEAAALAPRPGRSTAPTLVQETEPGQILGTVSYMSPEQVRGETVDHRSDIFSFGTILCEMIAGRNPFQRASTVDTMSAILRGDIQDGDALAAQPGLARIVHHCLEPERARRFASASDLAFALEGSTQSTTMSLQAPQAETRRSRAWIAAALAGMVLIAGGIWSAGYLSQAKPAPTVSHVRVALPPGRELSLRSGVSLAISPNGRLVALVASRPNDDLELWLQDLQTGENRVVARGRDITSPFFSHDSEWLGFMSERLMKASVRGGQPQTVAIVDASNGSVWARDGTIYHVGWWSGGMYQIEPEGKVNLFAKPTGRNRAFILPDLLPDDTVICTAWRGGDWDNAAILAIRKGKPEEPVTILERASFARYSATGHLLFVRQDTLYAVKFDWKTLQISGPVHPVIDRISSHFADGWAYFASSAAGIAIHAPDLGQTPNVQLTWVNPADGKTEPAVIPRGHIMSPKVSPDGRNVAAILGAPGTIDVHIFSLDRGGARIRLSTGEDDGAHVWSHSGEWIYFVSYRAGFGLWKRRSDGTGPEIQFAQGEHRRWPTSISNDDRFLAFEERRKETGSDLWIYDLLNTNAIPFLVTPVDEQSPKFHPTNSLWMAYSSRETSGLQIYIRNRESGRFFSLGTEGSDPVWSPNGSTLYFWEKGTIKSVQVIELERGIFSQPAVVVDGVNQDFDVAPDGRLLVTKESHNSELQTFYHLRLNWFADLEAAFARK